jgi:hypothetical protein
MRFLNTTTLTSSLNNFIFSAFDKPNDICGFLFGQFKTGQGCFDMPDEYGLIGFGDIHPCVRQLHVSTGVIHWATGGMAQKIDQKLFFSLYSIRTPVFPESAELRIVHQSWK